MPPATELDDQEKRVRLRARRIGLGVIMVVALAFIGSSTGQIVRAVFGLGTTPLAATPNDSPERQCAVGISRLVRAIAPPARGVAPLVRGAEIGWVGAETVERSCQNASGGLDAWDALLRLRAAQAQLAEASPADLQPLRDEVAAHLPSDLR